MLTSEDIQKLLEVLATKQDVEDIKKEVSDLKETTHALVDSIDKLAKAVDDLRIEYSSLAMKSDRHEKWILQLAEKLGLKLDYEQ